MMIDDDDDDDDDDNDDGDDDKNYNDDADINIPGRLESQLNSKHSGLKSAAKGRSTL